MTNFPISYDYILGKSEAENIYVQKKKIPCGTLRPYFEYDNEIPEEDIVYIPFDDIYTPATERKAFNGLILGGSGDMKSMFMKLIWSILSDAGYYCIYIDPKSTDSGRAKSPWGNDRLPPNLKPKGIKLKHYIPSFILSRYEHMSHNFHIYSLKLDEIYEKEMWMGLSLTKIASFKIAKIIKEYNTSCNLRILNRELMMMKENKEIASQTFDSAQSLLIDLEDFDFVGTKYKHIDMIEDFRAGYSICISYNSASLSFMSFDIGEKIHRCAKYYNSHNNRIPIMFFLDDSGYYAKEKKDILKYNFAVQEITNIGNVYRSILIYNFMAVQTLGIIDDNIAQTYRIKIITPSFSNPKSLRSINVPESVIERLEENRLTYNKEMNLIQYVLIDGNNEPVYFYPFLPPCNHFKEVYEVSS